MSHGTTPDHKIKYRHILHYLLQKIELVGDIYHDKFNKSNACGMAMIPKQSKPCNLNKQKKVLNVCIYLLENPNH